MKYRIRMNTIAFASVESLTGKIVAGTHYMCLDYADKFVIGTTVCDAIPQVEYQCKGSLAAFLRAKKFWKDIVHVCITIG